MNETRESKAQCDHEWKAEGLTEDKSHVRLVCVKCGAKKGDRALPINREYHYSEEHNNAAKRKLRRGRCKA